MARRRSKPDLPDWHLWRDVARTVTPLPGKPPMPDEVPLPLPETTAAASKQIVVSVPQAPAWPPSRPPRRLPVAREAGIEPRMKRRLNRGRIEIDGTLDLHGMRQVEAHAALNRFVRSRHARGDRTLLVITGKGLKKLDPYAATIIEAGVLRSMLPLWLNEPGLAPIVAGWDVSAQQHGGDGAFYVRLKRGAA